MRKNSRALAIVVGRCVLVLRLDVTAANGDRAEFVASDAAVDELVRALDAIEVPGAVPAHDGDGKRPVFHADLERDPVLALGHERMFRVV